MVLFMLKNYLKRKYKKYFNQINEIKRKSISIKNPNAFHKR